MTVAPDVTLETPKRPANRRTKLWSVRFGLVVLWLVSWELAATHWIDPFFYSKPSRI